MRLLHHVIFESSCIPVKCQHSSIPSQSCHQLKLKAHLNSWRKERCFQCVSISSTLLSKIFYVFLPQLAASIEIEAGPPMMAPLYVDKPLWPRIDVRVNVPTTSSRRPGISPTCNVLLHHAKAAVNFFWFYQQVSRMVWCVLRCRWGELKPTYHMISGSMVPRRHKLLRR